MPEPTPKPCPHPPASLWSWVASDAAAPKGWTLVIVCKACHTVLTGGAEL